MALVLNEEQVMLKDRPPVFLAEKATVAHLRSCATAATNRAFSATSGARWRRWAGQASLSTRPRRPGLWLYRPGLVLEQAGRNLSASPLQADSAGRRHPGRPLGSAPAKGQLLPAIAAGEQLVSLALQEGSHHAPLQPRPARNLGRQYVINGCKLMVLDAGSARCLLSSPAPLAAPGMNRA